MKKSCRNTCLLAALAALFVTDAYAQAALEEITVTARKRTENLQDVPISVVAFGAQEVLDAGIQRPKDFISLIPNVTLVNTANFGDTQVSIRGIVSTRDAESTFAYVVDGVLLTNPNAFNQQLEDIEEIQVLKGPQGALYGRNAVAGAVIIDTMKPTYEQKSKFVGKYGNNQTWGGTAIVSGPLVDNKLAASLVAYYDSTSGDYLNSLTGHGGEVNYLKNEGVRGRMIWEPTDDVTVDFHANYAEAKGGAINFNAVFAIPNFVTVLGSPQFYADVNDHDFIFAFNVPGENKQTTSNFSAKMDWAQDAFTTTFIAAYNNLNENLLSDGTSATFYGYEITDACQESRTSLNSFTRPDLFGPPLAPFLVLPPPSAGGANFAGIYGPYTPTTCDGYQYQERNQSDLSFELRLTSPQDQKIRWIGGLYYLNIDREVVVGYGADLGKGFELQPYIPPTGKNPTDLLFWDNFTTDVYSAYGQLEFDVMDNMELAFALRYDKEDRKDHNKVPNVDSSGYNINLAGQPINPAFNQYPNGVPDRKASFSELQPKITWTWEANDNVTAYASWGRGFRSGGFNSVGSEDLINYWYNVGYGGPGELVNSQLTITDEYPKEVTDSWEIGVKSMLMDNRLRLSGAYFNTSIHDNQFFEFFAGPFGLMRVVTTIDKASISGWEANFDFAATDYLRFYGGLGLLNSEIKKNINRPLSVGNDMPQAPGETYNLGGQLDLPMNDSWNFMFRLDWRYVGKMWFHTLQGEEVPTIWNALFQAPIFDSNMSKARRDAYNTLDARMVFSDDNWLFTLWGRNLTDENYLQEVIPAPEFGGSFIHPSSLRTYGIEVTRQF